ncbi:thrombospondin type-1 domain-containing protein 7B isoform X2 [Tachysurus fulvidraco]|uniref:thrombospondin type-1 domain-containing protein 7B isoform X2 n=1 Tax=Tachysurus fulvidraco TaxID=1234273 RepID=UPI001FF05C2F|nr:thrombospondin type-1 domain-containing protein 7B isoform X2 [Tachysurus fulvidraco]
MWFLNHGLVFFSFIQNSLLCLSLIVTAASTDAPKKNPFSWKTGMWSECKASECGSAGLQVRSVFCVHSEGWSTHQSNCQLWKRPGLQRTCVKVCEWQRQLFEWQTSAWGPCSPTPPLAAEQCVTAQNGLQKRTAICVLHLNGTTVSSHMCETFSPTPELERACLLPCPLDCVVSTFSQWSPCSRTCAPALQHRTRQVLAPPLYGGSACPSLTQVRPCSQNVAQCPSDPQKHSYSLWAGSWSPCRRKGLMPSGRTTVEFSNSLSGHIVVKSSHNIKQHAGNFLFHHHHDHHRSLKAAWDIHVGYQTRQVRCMRSDGKNAMLSLCDHVGTIINFRSCLMPRDCDVSAWSAWGLCSKTCRATDQSAGFRSRKRSVRTVPIAGGEECPALEEVETCNTLEELLPLCPRYDWKLTNWGPCQVRPLISQHDHRHGNSSFLCGGGIQTREAYCVRIFANTTKSHMSRPVEQNLCYNAPPSMIQFCSIPCFKPCHLSDWSPWGPCIHDNSVEHPGTKGFKSRMRFIVEEPWGESESCPHVSEVMTCDHPISFQWHVISQGPCMPQNGACGHGVQEQAVECVSVTGDVVPTERCPGDPPPLQKLCEMPCPEDCVLGEWSSWSSCSHCCSSKQVQGKQTRSRVILAPSGEHGMGCLPAPVLQQWRVCGIQGFTVYYWETSPWGPCTPDSGTDKNSTEQEEVEEMGCGTGIQTRFVSCRRSDSGELEPYSCPESTRPEQKRSCILLCKLDCIVTPFSEWGPCPTSCSPKLLFSVNSSIRTQSRHRIIIQRPANGGQECPATLLEERECDPQTLCPTYRWQTHHWNQCILVPDSVRQTIGSHSEACGIGLQTRLTCIGMDDAPADMTECVQWAGAMPTAVQKCRVACKDDCIFSSWSKFSPCQSCGGSRTRTRTLIGRSKKWWRCQQERLVEREACPCSEYHTQAHGLWSPCLFPKLQPPIRYPLTKRSSHLVQRITQAWHVHAEGKECGQGWRYRALACLDHHERLVNPALCNSSGVEEEACAVPCPVDCRLSEWSTWSSCSAPCGGGVKVRARWLREKPFNGGRPCPKLNVKNQAQVSEVVPCYSECNRYSWEAEPWSMCVINSPSAISITRQTQPLCGEGIQTRRIRCVREEEDRRSSVSDSLCGQFDRPIAAQACYLPCPGQCVTSEWSLWTECPMGCNEKGFRWRSKRVLRMPGSGHTCPELNQTQSCTNTTCVSYSYAYSDWSSCRLSDNAVCGQGTKTRLLNCIDGKGKLVELSMCKEWGPSRGKLSAPCEVGCPVDCLLSDWSLWSECSHTCGAQSQMTRSRLVVHQAGDSGRPCSSQLSQTKPCPIQPCYSWMLGDWSSCNVEGAECGDGVKERNISCVVHWGSLSGPPHPKAVQGEHCVENGLSKVMMTELQQPCSIPCPGDCHLTTWSQWSMCQLLCLDGRSFEMLGHQARSRAVIVQVLENKASCPSQVYETRPCQRGTCLSYEWVTGEWKENQRAVWCQRSDGVNVTGGCFLQTKPSTVRQCTPACTKPFSFCTQGGMCGCEKGFTEVVTSSGFLDYCTKTPESDYKKANAKRSGGRLRRLHKQNESRTWTLQPLGPDGRVRLWVYGLMAGGFIMILLIITMSFLLCKNPKDDKNSSRTQRALALAYDGDTDM